MAECDAAKIEGAVESVYCGSGVDGKGLRVVVFFGGCNLRCPFCHNPETLYRECGKTTAAAVVDRCLKYRGYIRRGGVTLSGGEPFMQPEFCLAIIRGLQREGVNVAIETNGHIVNREIIAAADSFIADVKNQITDDLSAYERFLGECDRAGKEVVLSNVLVPEVNDSKEKIAALRALKDGHACVKRVKFLPFHKMCEGKYAELGREFPFAKYREADPEDVAHAERLFAER